MRIPGEVARESGMMSPTIPILDYGLSSATKVEYKPRTIDCFCGFERWHGTKSSFKKASVRLRLPLFTERRIGAGRR